jgi:uncharacterized lipoprotein YmbA
MTRITRLPVLAAAAALPLLLAACGSTPSTNYYTLASSAPRADAEAAVAASPLVFAVGPVQMPDYVDRPQIVIRQSDYRLELAENDYWAAPLDDLVPRVLVEDLQRRLPGSRVVGFPQVAGPNFNYRVAVDIGRFDVDAGGTATIAARWQIYAATSPRAVVVDDSTLQSRGEGTGYAAAVAALSNGLAELSDRIAHALQTLPQPVAPSAAPAAR